MGWIFNANACIERANLLVGEVTSFSLVHLCYGLHALAADLMAVAAHPMMGVAAQSDRVRQLDDDGIHALALRLSGDIVDVKLSNLLPPQARVSEASGCAPNCEYS